MKNFLSLFILLLILLTGCGKKVEKDSLEKIIEKDEIVVGIKSDSKPFCYKNVKTGKLEGFDIDVAKYVAKDILGNERKIKFVEVTPNKRIEAITSGEVDMVIATMTVTPQRQYLVDFSAPYYIAGQTAVVKEDSDIYTFSDLKRKTTIVVLGTTAEQNIRKIIPTAKIVGYKDYKSAFNALLQGKGDAMSTDDTIISGFINDHNDYRILKNRISQEPYAIGIKQYDDQKLKKTLDVIVTRMKKDGTVKELKQKWHLK
ncbi:transporter substrate-binding domain-containing protein [bacterium]|nr:transporter substrate-binding domain-containing protein [bacterium]